MSLQRSCLKMNFKQLQYKKPNKEKKVEDEIKQFLNYSKTAF